jgi:diguanylate cyclase (GGDEF) domain
MKKQFKQKSLLIPILFVIIIICLLVTAFCFCSYFLNYKIDNALYYLIAGSIAIVIAISLVILLVFEFRKQDVRNEEVYAPIGDAISNYVFNYSLKTKKITLAIELAKFIGSKRNVLSIDEISKLFANLETTKIDYDDLVNAGSISMKLKTNNGKYIAISFFPSRSKREKFIVGYVNDFTLQHIEEQTLLKQAHIDTLTETYRRSYFVKNVKERMLVEGEKGALVFFDVDNFKGINDKYGHSSGDLVLMKLGNALRNYCQNKNAYIARSGGDEFLIYFYSLDDYKKVYEYLKDLVYVIKTISATEIGIRQIYVSMGVALFPLHSNNYETLLKYADDSLYRAKNIPGTAFSVYDFDKVSNELNMEDSDDNNIAKDTEEDIFTGLNLSQIGKILREGMRNHEFKVYIQPEVSLDGKKVYGECLCRWVKSDSTIYYPSNFVSYFERTGLVTDFDLYIFEECLKISQERIKAGDNVKLAFNQSIKSIIDPEYSDKITEIYKKYNIVKGSLAVEITEKAMFNGLRHITKVIDFYHKLGFQVLIDDFGNGFTSISIIKDLDIDVIKIDRSFLSNPEKDYKKCEAIIRGLCYLANSLNIVTVVEGVEEKEQLEMLKNVGANFVQGFYISQAIKPKDFFDEKKKAEFAGKLLSK